MKLRWLDNVKHLHTTRYRANPAVRHYRYSSSMIVNAHLISRRDGWSSYRTCLSRVLFVNDLMWLDTQTIQKRQFIHTCCTIKFVTEFHTLYSLNLNHREMGHLMKSVRIFDDNQLNFTDTSSWIKSIKTVLVLS